MAFKSAYLFLIGHVLNQFVHVNCRIEEGIIETHKDWIFITRFCFYNATGQFSYVLSFPEEYLPQSLLLYYDDLWPQAYGSESFWAKSKLDKTCSEKQSMLRADKYQILSLVPGQNGCVKDESLGDGQAVVRCSQQATFESERERWWYIVLSNCQTRKGLKLTYKFILENKDPSSWLAPFSADQFYILHTDVAFCILYIIVGLFATYQAYLLNTRRLLHSTYKLFLASVFCHLIGLIFLVAFYGHYASKGLELTALKFAGRSFMSISRVLFLLLLILLAKGYSVTRARLKPATSARVAVFMTLYTVLYACLFYYEHQYFDPGKVLYTYESPAGIGLIFLNITAMFWFIYSVWHTWQIYPTKKTFFVILLIMYCLWFISLAIIVIIATFAIPKFRREKIVNAVEMVVAIRAHFFFMVLTWPAKFNRIFPYHVRTTQIDLMNKSGPASEGTLDNFSRYQYAPTGDHNVVPSQASPSIPRRQSVNVHNFSRYNMTTGHASSYGDSYLSTIG
ncbi:Transmembrane protein [Halotydeus destructor]|nr:Transmembrane protein [Halotydeus destructor]